MAHYRFVDDLPDLIRPEDYVSDPQGKRVRVSIRVTEHGVEILGDSPQAKELEALLESLTPESIEQMLCG